MTFWILISQTRSYLVSISSLHFRTSYLVSMACTSIPHKYDVFLSFRGEDTRNSFTDHLYEALRKAGITTFRDDDEIREGRELKPEIERSIRESRASIIVFSENFANSRWCLDELWLILEERRKGGHYVLPVFYGVDPSDIRNQRGSFKIKAKYGFKRSKWTKDNVKRWKAALTEVADLKGMTVSGSETTFIEDVVHKIYCELDLKLHTIPTNLPGIESRAEGINTWLNTEQPGSPVLAICGMGGIGKTTLAKYIYNSNKQNFESSSFLEQIENQPSALLGLQKQLLTDLGNNIMISSVSEGALHIVKATQRKKALIILDDIDDPDQLSTLFGTKVLHTQSKIIITTRHLRLDTLFESISSGCHVHEVELLNHDESLELLSWHAFGSKIPMEGFEELAIQLAEYCEGNPLALKVLGSSLPVRAQDQRTRNNMIEMWRSRMTSLNSVKGDLDHKIQCVLYKSFESLPCDSHRELFLHIASLFIGEYAGHVEKILEKDWHAKSGIRILINRCLITVSRDGFRLAMHKLFEDMASKIVRKESKFDPAKRSRVWHKDEAYRLLRKGDVSETIEGLLVNMLEPEHWMTLEAFNTSSLVKMKNLKLLQLQNVKLTGSYENFPDLRWLSWHGCYLKTVPPGLLSSFLVALYMGAGDLEEFDPPMVLNSLKILDLSYSSHLVSICNFIQLPKLEDLSLKDCISLTHVCKTIGDLENLSYLELSGCTKLWKASSNQEFVNQQERIKVVFISGGIPEEPFFSLPQSLSILSLAGNPFEMLPSHIDLIMLKVLDLCRCPNLKSLPCLPDTLEKLYVDWSSSLERITFQSSRFTLHRFDYEGCFKLCEVEGLFKLVSISKLDEADLAYMLWIKAYQDHKVDLVGDVITVDRTFNIQMLYEYGIRSTFLQGIKDQSMVTHEYTSPSYCLSFHVPLDPKNRRIQGLNVTVLYRSSSGEEDRNSVFPLFARISNTTMGVTWVYNPVVYCKPGVDEEVIWLSYWPIGDTLDTGDGVHVTILAKEGTVITNGYGASLVYMDDCEVEKEEKSELMKSEEVIGGDLSLLEVTKGGYYLCRRDFFGSIIPASVFGEIIQITDSRRWRTCAELAIFFQVLNDIRNPNHQNLEVTFGVNLNSESEADKIAKAVSSLVGVESVSTNKDTGRLYVRGRFDPHAVLTCVREFEKMVQVLYYTELPKLSAQDLKKDSLLHKKENGSEGKIDDESDDELFDFSEPLFYDESQV